METLRNKRKSAGVTRETQEEHPRNGQSRNTSVPRINEEYITQVFEEIEGRVNKKLSQEFSRTESRVLGALPKLDEFPLNPHIRTHSGTVPGAFRNTNLENREPNEDHSQVDPHPEVGPSVCQSRYSIDLDTDEAPHTYKKVFTSSSKTFDAKIKEQNVFRECRKKSFSLNPKNHFVYLAFPQPNWHLSDWKRESAHCLAPLVWLVNNFSATVQMSAFRNPRSHSSLLFFPKSKNSSRGSKKMRIEEPSASAGFDDWG